MTEEIKLHSKGTIPLYLDAITNQTITKHNRAILMRMKDIYPFIRSISHEYSEIYGREELYYPIRITLEGDDNTGYRLKADITTETHLRNLNKRYIKVLKGFNSVPKIHKKKKKTIIDKTGINSYTTKFVKDSKENARKC